MPPQLKILIPLFAVFISLFLIARYFLVPDSFGEQGHYRFNSVEENKNKVMQYAGKNTCADCHDEKAAELESDMHANISCESCHGPGLNHYDNPEASNIVIPSGREFCGLCHGFNPTRKGKIAQVALSEHNVDNNCIECHNPHLPWEIAE